MGICISPETNSEFATENGWLVQMILSYWVKRPIFRDKFAVSLRVDAWMIRCVSTIGSILLEHPKNGIISLVDNVLLKRHQKKNKHPFFFRCSNLSILDWVVSQAKNRMIFLPEFNSSSLKSYPETPKKTTLPETNIAHENPIFPGKYHQNCGFSMAMLVSGSVVFQA